MHRPAEHRDDASASQSQQLQQQQQIDVSRALTHFKLLPVVCTTYTTRSSASSLLMQSLLLNPMSNIHLNESLRVFSITLNCVHSGSSSSASRCDCITQHEHNRNRSLYPCRCRWTIEPNQTKQIACANQQVVLWPRKTGRPRWVQHHCVRLSNPTHLRSR